MRPTQAPLALGLHHSQKTLAEERKWAVGKDKDTDAIYCLSQKTKHFVAFVLLGSQTSVRSHCVFSALVLG